MLENVRIALQRKLGTTFHFWKRESSLAALDPRAMELLDVVDLGPFAGMIAVELPYGRKRALEIATTLAWVTVIIGAVFIACVLAFRRGIVGELAALRPRRSSTSHDGGT